MKKSAKVTQLVLLVFSLLSVNLLAEQVNPHIILNDKNSECLSCHLLQPEQKVNLNTKNFSIDFSQFHADGVTMCTTCHSEEEGHVVAAITCQFEQQSKSIS